MSNHRFLLKREHCINELGQKLLTAKNFDSFKREALSHLERLFSADDSLFLDWTPITYGDRRWAGDDLFSSHHHHDSVLSYYERFHEDPVYQWATSPNCQNDHYVTLYSRLVNFSDFKKTPFYNDLFSPRNYRFVLTMVFNKGDDLIGNISLMRFKGQKDFSSADVKLAKMITPMINGAYQNLLLKEEVAVKGTVFGIVASLTQDHAYVILSQSMRTIYHSPQGRSILSWLKKNQPFHLQELLLNTPSLNEFLSLFMSPQKSKRKRLPQEVNGRIPVTSKKQLGVTLQTFSDNTDQLYVLVKMTPSQHGVEQPALHTQFDLTLRELQVAQLATEGLSSRDIAQRLSISPWSIKNHLKNIYKKVGVNNRTKLSHQLKASDPSI